MCLADQVLNLLSSSTGLKAREVARKLGVERHDVNCILYGILKDKCFQDSNYAWYLKNPNQTTKEEFSENIQTSNIELELSSMNTLPADTIAEEKHLLEEILNNEAIMMDPIIVLKEIDKINNK